jgi:hypothetical protein
MKMWTQYLGDGDYAIDRRRDGSKEGRIRRRWPDARIHGVPYGSLSNLCGEVWGVMLPARCTPVLPTVVCPLQGSAHPVPPLAFTPEAKRGRQDWGDGERGEGQEWGDDYGCVLEATSISSALVPYVRSVGFRAAVHSVFDHVVNLVTQGGHLVSVMVEELGNFPHGILVIDPHVPFGSLGLRVGILAFGTGNGALRLPQARVVVHLHSASVWPASMQVEPTLGKDDIRHNLSVLECVAQASTEKAGLSLLIPHWQALLCAEMPQDGELNAVGRAARGPLLHLLRGMQRKDRRATLEAARDLIGLGVGLTPSGDDLLIGLMVSLLSLGGHSASAKDVASLAQDIAALSRGRTTLISQAFLQHAANNETSEILRDLISSVLTASDVQVAMAAERVLRIGSSSGAELVLGVLLGVGLGLELANLEPWGAP